MCTQQNIDIDCCGPCFAVDDGNNVGVIIIVHVSTFHLVPRLRMSGQSPPLPHIEEPMNQILLHETQTGCNSIKCKVSCNAIPVAARSKALVWDRSLAGIPGSNPIRGMEVCLMSVLCVVS